MSLFGELKRRKVFRVATAYVVLGWVLLQVADTIAPMMGLPETAPRFVLFLLIVLFPVAVFLAWALELRPTDGQAPTREAAGRSVIGLGIAVVFAAALGWYLLWDAEERGEVGTAPAAESVEMRAAARASIAVLPFSDLSPEGDQEYFGDGIAEELLNVLAALEDLAVASRTSSFAFKGANRNVADIAKILNVAYVLEGSVRKASDRLRITAQLIDAATDRHLWSETYDRELTTDNIFAIQDEISEAIVAALNDELGLGLEADVAQAPITANVDAYDLYLRAKQIERIISVSNAYLIVDYLEQSVQLDPEFAAAWGMLANWNSWLPTWDHSLDPRTYNQRAIEFAERALRIDPALADGYHALASAYVNLFRWQDYAEAVAKGAEMVPDWIDQPEQLFNVGYLEAAYENASLLLERSPQDNFYPLIQALYFNDTGQPEKAIPKFEEAILNGYVGGAEYDQAHAYLALGDSGPMTAHLSQLYEAYDKELQPLLPHIVKLLQETPNDFKLASSRFRSVARELGYTEQDLVRPGPRWDLRVPPAVTMAYGNYDALTDNFWGNSPMLWMWAPSLQRWRRSDSFRERVRSTGLLAFWQEYGWPDLCRAVGADDFECD